MILVLCRPFALLLTCGGMILGVALLLSCRIMILGVAGLRLLVRPSLPSGARPFATLLAYGIMILGVGAAALLQDHDSGRGGFETTARSTELAVWCWPFAPLLSCGIMILGVAGSRPLLVRPSLPS